MMLRQIQYQEYATTPRKWRLQKITLGRVNLLVGRNATGKTRTLSLINGLAKLVSVPGKLEFDDADYIVSFDQELSAKYELSYREKNVTKERLSMGGKKRLERSASETHRLEFTKELKSIEVSTPRDEVLVASRQDSLQHPFLDPIREWGQGVIQADLKRSFLVANPDEKDINLAENDYSAIVLYVRGYQQFRRAFDEAIIADMGELGYHLTGIGADFDIQSQYVGIGTLAGGSVTNAKAFMLWIKEKGVGTRIFQVRLSDGMFRALSLVILSNYLAMSRRGGALLVDNLGDGLDFVRSSGLVKLLIKRCQNLQLILASNDELIMNAVPLEHWIVLTRQGAVCKGLTYESHPSLFDEFRFTGLSNFDFFATSFWEAGQGK